MLTGQKSLAFPCQARIATSSNGDGLMMHVVGVRKCPGKTDAEHVLSVVKPEVEKRTNDEW